MKNFDPALYLVTDRLLSRERPIEFIVEQAVKGGVTMVQLREKNCSTLEFVKLAISLKKLLAHFHVPLIINDRLDVALASDADGLHIGQEDMPCNIARKILGNDKIIGLSVESFDQALEANNLDVDYIGISPVFVTGTKPELTSALGLAGIRKISSVSKHPVVAIGGINAKNAAEVLMAGADGLAVVSAIVSADDPMKAARELRKIIDIFKNSSQ
ncbi:MAG TPA: thiamine phosphate synthase [Bacteroidales bacterium]|nr:thiamine phosphate synthase [Bacteroidales bacterium]HOU96807.1 thiamine phosphate synthase [Bacteroidales bacterium]HQG37396.1 thiamine phosphate synthase [Bacteroidales bacterium]HQG52012.1 thiamine phosphate synthase [Bacteroidales bacterium]HQJ21523.1 thiamine phosphate synthase [Bacteroidales bacterium]